MRQTTKKSLNEVANSYKKMILEEYQSNNSNTRRPSWNPITGPGAIPFIPPKKPPVETLPDDLEDLPFDLSPDLPDRPDAYRAPGPKVPLRVPTVKPTTPGGAGRLLGPALLGYYLGNFIDDVFINPNFRPPKPGTNQQLPTPTEQLPSPESLYPSPTTATGFSTPARPSGGGGGSGGGMGGL